MRGAIPPLSQYAFTVWCSVEAQGQFYLVLRQHRDNTVCRLTECEDTEI
jgi:hypothetical protein